MDQDDEVMQAATAGDRAAFAAVVHAHGQVVHAYLARRAGGQVADELLTEVWLRAWRSRHTFNDDWPSPRPWLYGIARNALRAHWRQRVDSPHVSLELSGDPWPDVDDRLEADRLRPALEAALNALTDENREVLLLVAWEQLTPSEAAIALDVPPSTIRSRLHRARWMLQRQLGTDLVTNPNPNYMEARP